MTRSCLCVKICYRISLVYDEDVKHPFTMSGVKFPLKMIFLDRYFNVLEVLIGRPGIKSISPSVNYRYVIELPL